MKRILLLVVLAGVAHAQSAPAQQPSTPAPQVALTNIVERAQAPTYSDSYCAGFITDQGVPRDKYVSGDWGTPHQTKSTDRDYVYLAGGGYQEGARYTILRELRDPNVSEDFKGQRGMLKPMGQPYAEVGRVLVVGAHGNTGITQVEFSCAEIMPGDLAVPFAPREVPTLRATSRFDRFAPPNGKLTGHIVMAKDFDTLLGTGQKIYLNVGGGQGVKVGDYFRITREYTEIRRHEGDSVSFAASQIDDTQKNYVDPRKHLEEFPRIGLGEAVVLNVTPSSSTAMIVNSLETIYLGDGVEMEEPPPPAPAKAPEPMNPPTISCSANPATVRVGETATITCQGASPDNRPIQIHFASNGGSMTERDNLGMLTSNEPGNISVKATVSDDRNLTAEALTTVNVEPPPPAPTASKTNEITFKPRSAYVDNRAKAVLDDVALRLQQDPNSSITLVGHSDAKEAKTLANRRATNAAAYLTKSKGIDPGRVHTKTSDEPSKTTEIWMVPQGAQGP